MPTVDYPNCTECCGTPLVPAICGDCTLMPYQYKVTLAGIADGSCNLCDENFNGTFTITKFGNENTCLWLLDLGFFCDGTNGITLFYNPGGYWEFSIGSSSFNTYRLAPEDFDCTGVNVMPLVTDAGYCTNLPATVTLTPV